MWNLKLPACANKAEISRKIKLKLLEIRYGLNDPAYIRFFKWITGFVQGDFGESFQYRQEVKDLIGQRLRLPLAFRYFRCLLAWGIAVPIGVYSATHRYTIPDYIITVFQFLGTVDSQLPGRPGA